MQTITRTRAKLLKAVEECRDAGGTTTHMLHTIARMTTGPAAAPPQFERETANVFDTAGFYYLDLSSEYERTTGATPYPWQTASFDDLTGDDQMKVIQYVINEFGEPDVQTEKPAPMVLADHLLDGLRVIRKLRVECGDHIRPAENRVRTALVALLNTQSVTGSLALEAIGHALATGCGIHQAVAEMDGQL
ncbi:hypothetical protein AB0L53_47040 [Nonomuraea sp. NPDC052129]|uniref:hypothetical protein n=1 Tax=Nonomuraea sp. NPDC052129 TaxID=3154651 RepID=UPI003412202D